MTGTPPGHTALYDAAAADFDGTPHYPQIAAAFGAHDMPAPELTCPGDLDDSGDVNFADVLLVLAAWGPCEACPEDIDGSGAVGFEEILYLLSQYGPCRL